VAYRVTFRFEYLIPLLLALRPPSCAFRAARLRLRVPVYGQSSGRSQPRLTPTTDTLTTGRAKARPPSLQAQSHDSHTFSPSGLILTLSLDYSEPSSGSGRLLLCVTRAVPGVFVRSRKRSHEALPLSVRSDAVPEAALLAPYPRFAAGEQCPLPYGGLNLCSRPIGLVKRSSLELQLASVTTGSPSARTRSDSPYP
jgi:hypothetical protein